MSSRQEFTQAHTPITYGLETIANVIDVVSLEQERAGLNGPELFDYRGILFHVLDRPCSGTWDRAYQLVLRSPVHAEPVSLWTAVLHFTSYDYSSHFAGQHWPKVPSQGQLLATLAQYHRDTGISRKPRLAAPWEDTSLF